MAEGRSTNVIGRVWGADRRRARNRLRSHHGRVPQPRARARAPKRYSSVAPAAYGHLIWRTALPAHLPSRWPSYWNCHQIHVHQSSSKSWRHGLYPFRVTASPHKPRARWLTEVFIQLDVSGLLDDWIPIGKTTEVPAHQVGAIGQPLVDMAAGLRPSGHPPGRLYAVDSCTGQRAQEPTGYELGSADGRPTTALSTWLLGMDTRPSPVCMRT
jgi:hypothetical protein